jgi:hypothetical protein
MLFRPQRLTVKDGIVLVADERRWSTAAMSMITPRRCGDVRDAKARNLDVMPATASGYFERSDAFDMVMDFRFGERRGARSRR